MSVRNCIVALAVAPVLALAACGSDDGDDFLTDADSICREGAVELVDTRAEAGVPDGPEEQAELDSADLAVREETLGQLQTLEAPDDLAGQYDEFLGLREQLVANLTEYNALFAESQRPDEAKVQELDEEFYSLFDEQQALGSEVGFEECAAILPDDVEEQVSSYVENTLETADPTFCTEAYTENFVEQIGGLEKCEKSESDDSAAGPVEILDVGGVSEVNGYFDFVPESGPNEGQPATVSLVYEDGVYKRDAIFPLPPSQAE